MKPVFLEAPFLCNVLIDRKTSDVMRYGTMKSGVEKGYGVCMSHFFDTSLDDSKCGSIMPASD